MFLKCMFLSEIDCYPGKNSIVCSACNGRKIFKLCRIITKNRGKERAQKFESLYFLCGLLALDGRVNQCISIDEINFLSF